MDQLIQPMLGIGFILTIFIVPCLALAALALAAIADKFKGFLLHLALFAFYFLLFIGDFFVLLDCFFSKNFYWPLFLGLFLLPGSIPHTIILRSAIRQKNRWRAAADICGLLTTIAATLGVCIICHFARFVG